MPRSLFCMTEMISRAFLCYTCAIKIMVHRVTDEVRGLMCVSEFMLKLSLGVNVSEQLETTKRPNADGRASSGELTFMAHYLWTDIEEYNP